MRRAAADGLRATILRIANVYGAASDHADRLVPAFGAAALAGRALIVRGSDRTLDLVHVRDAEAAIISAAEALTRGDAGAGAINVCSGVETTLSALAGRVVTLSASDSVFHAADPAPYEVDRFVGDNRAARSALSWVPRVSLDAGLVKIIHSAARLRHPAVAVERMLQ